MATPTTKRLIFLFVSVFCSAPGIALGDDDTRTVNCARGDSIQREIDKRQPERPLTLVIQGVCSERVTVRRNDLTFVGEAGATVNGTITVLGGQRVLIQRLTVTGPGEGVVATENASVTIEDSFLDGNELDGAVIRNGAHATIRRTSFANNGHLATVPDRGRGLDVRHGANVDARTSTFLNNRSDGIGVYNNSYARLVGNTIEGNGRLLANEAGIQVSRSRVRADANIIRNNTGISALIVVNDGNYRTGSSLNTVDFPDNEFGDFERIEHAAGGGRIGVDINNASYGDLRQVHIVGSVSVGRQSYLQVRGDDVGPNVQCSTITLPPGEPIQVSGRNGLLRLVFVTVTPPAFNVGTPNGQREGNGVCPPAP